MKTKYKLDENYSLIVIKDNNTGSNYDVFAHVVETKSNLPICGTSFESNSTIKLIREWANEKLKSYDPIKRKFKSDNLMF